MNYSRILSVGSYLPKRILTNIELENMVDTTDAWITLRTGIRQRHIASDFETAASMAEIAAGRCLEMCDIDVQSIDLIIVATCTPDKVFPSTACLLQERLKIRSCVAFDITAACAGFIYAMGVADQFIRNGSAKRVLVVGSEIMSRIVNWKDRGTCVLFGDGAGAMILEKSEAPGIYSVLLHSDGNLKDVLYVPNKMAGSKKDTEDAYMVMQGGEVFKLAVGNMSSVAEEILKIHGLTSESLDWLIPHQANLRIINAIARKCGLAMDRVIVTVDSQGNTSSASIPLAVDTAIRDNRIQRGHHLLLEGFGGGLTWGAALVKY